MGRHGGVGVRRGVIASRVAVIAGVLVVAVFAVAGPALADQGTPGVDNTRLVKGTPCTAAARACVDIKGQKAWLIDKDGNISRGPMKITTGGPGQETPVGTFKVQWKDRNHKSAESLDPKGQPAAMPYSVFFAEGGVAFHGGSLRRESAGCVHLGDADAIAFFDTLQLGDQVQVYGPAPKQLASKSTPDKPDAKPATAKPEAKSAEDKADRGRPAGARAENAVASRPAAVPNLTSAGGR